MPDLPLSASIAQAQQMLADLQIQFPSLSPDCQSALCSELDRLTAILKEHSDLNTPAVQKKRPKKKKKGDANISLSVLENERRIGMVLRRAHAGVFVRDLVQKTVTWSPELYGLLGIDPAEPSRSERFIAMIHSEDLPRVLQDTQRAIEQGGTYSQKFRITRPDGEELFEQVNVA